MNPRYFNNQQYQLKRKLSSGSFGIVFLAIDTHTKEEVAIKVERNDNQDTRSIDREVGILSKLQGIRGVPKYLWSGFEQEQNVMVIQLLGKDLAHHMKQMRKFTLKTILLLAEGIIPVLQSVHQRGILHRDLKPENIMMGKDNDQSQVYLVDYGISKSYKDLNGRHIPYRDNRPFLGTTRYASIAAHRGQELSRKDDIESLIYVLIFLFKGVLPWQNINTQERDRTKLVGDMKMSIDTGELCRDLPIEIQTMLDYVRKLAFRVEPDYGYLLVLVRRSADNNGIVLDSVFDWTDLKTIQKFRSQESINSVDVHMKHSGTKGNNGLWMSQLDPNNNRLLLPPGNGDRHESRKNSYSSHVVSSQSSMKLKFQPSICQLESPRQQKESPREFVPAQSLQPDDKDDHEYMKYRSTGDEKFRPDFSDNEDVIIEENAADQPLALKFDKLRKNQVQTYVNIIKNDRIFHTINRTRVNIF